MVEVGLKEAIFVLNSDIRSKYHLLEVSHVSVYCVHVATPFQFSISIPMLSLGRSALFRPLRMGRIRRAHPVTIWIIFTVLLIRIVIASHSLQTDATVPPLAFVFDIVCENSSTCVSGHRRQNLTGWRLASWVSCTSCGSARTCTP